MNQFHRRSFLKSSVATGVAVTTSGVFQQTKAANTSGPNDELRVGVIGLKGRGKSHVNGFTAAEGSRLVAFCDVDETILDASASSYEAAHHKVDRYTDFRKLLERKDIDVVTIATPNHWHSLLTIEAVQNGKHVYVEKPVCHTIWEGRQMVAAMKKYDRVVGAGFQNRSDVGLRAAFDFVHSGELGDIKQVRGLCYRNRASIGKRDEPLAPPKSVDYDLWLGPAEDLPIMRPQFHYDWHWIWNTGNGDMGNQGPHEMDLVRWVLGDPQHPQRVMSYGGRFGWDDAGNTPNMQFASFDFGTGVPVLFEVRDLRVSPDSSKGASYKGRGVGVIVTCEDGEYRGGRGGGAVYDNDGREIRKFKGDSGKTHFQNFVNAVQNEDASSLRSPLESAYYSSSLSHLANISVRTGESIAPQELAKRLTEDSLATETLGRFSEHLAAWPIDFAQTPWSLGPSLQFDSKAEKFIGGENHLAANHLVRRADREPWIVPEIS